MQTESITISVSQQAARAFHNASPAMQRHIQELLEFALLDDKEQDDAAFEHATSELERAAEEIGEHARRRGLSDEKLDAILNEPKAACAS